MSVFGKNSGALLAKVNPNVKDPEKDKKDPPGDAEKKANALGAQDTGNPVANKFKSSNPAFDPNYELANLSEADLEKLDPNQQYVFASNHESAFDIPLTLAGIPWHVVPIAKKELKGRLTAYQNMLFNSLFL